MGLNLIDLIFKPGWADFAPHTTSSHPPDSKSYLHLKVEFLECCYYSFLLSPNYRLSTFTKVL